MSVKDEEAKANMALDIDQLDAIIDKFMDYRPTGRGQARGGQPRRRRRARDRGVPRHEPDEISSRVGSTCACWPTTSSSAAVLQNLFENARRYGRSTNTGLANVIVNCSRAGEWVILSVRDHGQGVDPKKIAQLTTPFFRGDAARTAATGAGLGLAIVDKAVQRMGGSLELSNAPDGGLMAHVRLKRA
jgi:two-component system osmolarity sensor histidine kinase EnvZ